jgi:hypothetical protein
VSAADEADAVLAWAREDPLTRVDEAVQRVGKLPGDDPTVRDVASSLQMMSSAARYLMTHHDAG